MHGIYIISYSFRYVCVTDDFLLHLTAMPPPAKPKWKKSDRFFINGEVIQPQDFNTVWFSLAQRQGFIISLF